MQIKRFSIKTTYYPYTERDIGGLKWEKSSFDTYPVLPPGGFPHSQICSWIITGLRINVLRPHACTQYFMCRRGDVPVGAV